MRFRVTSSTPIPSSMSPPVAGSGVGVVTGVALKNNNFPSVTLHLALSMLAAALTPVKTM